MWFYEYFMHYSSLKVDSRPWVLSSHVTPRYALVCELCTALNTWVALTILSVPKTRGKFEPRKYKLLSAFFLIITKKYYLDQKEEELSMSEGDWHDSLNRVKSRPEAAVKGRPDDDLWRGFRLRHVEACNIKADPAPLIRFEFWDHTDYVNFVLTILQALCGLGQDIDIHNSNMHFESISVGTENVHPPLSLNMPATLRTLRVIWKRCCGAPSLPVSLDRWQALCWLFSLNLFPNWTAFRLLMAQVNRGSGQDGKSKNSRLARANKLNVLSSPPFYLYHKGYQTCRPKICLRPANLNAKYPVKVLVQNWNSRFCPWKCKLPMAMSSKGWILGNPVDLRSLNLMK